MQTILILTLALHVLAGVFWAGSTFTLARTAGANAERLFGPQMGAATFALLTGAVLWHLLHGSAFGSSELVLAIGILAAFVAAGVQGAAVGSARRKLVSAAATEAARLRARMATGQRIAAGLLAVTVVCMAVARAV
ncbi:hypothetical protein [Rhodospirillaceae bacterium SYSU D60014]|uniref:hypothetical protein n=1 Tax=Virgifigura deserti TaxID=2268457 RepID=UPI000E65F2A2